MSGNYELQILKQVRLLKGPVKANFSHVVGFVVVDQEPLLCCPVMAVLKDKPPVMAFLKKQTYDEHQDPPDNALHCHCFRNYRVLFIRPRSDHSLRISLTD